MFWIQYQHFLVTLSLSPLFFFVHYSIILLSQNACLVLKVLKIPSIFYFDFDWVFLELEGTWYYLSTMGKLLKFYIDSVAKGVAKGVIVKFCVCSTVAISISFSLKICE